MLLRKATLNDVELLVRLRIDYLTEDRCKMLQGEETAVKTQLRTYFTKHIPDNTFIAILAEDESRVISTAFLSVSEKPANPAFITGSTGTLLNVLTYTEYRKKGFATKVINMIIDEAKKAGVSRIDLSATSEGKYVYEKIGFRESSYTAMSLKLI